MTVSKAELDQEVENEWYSVRHSGEIPEIALCSALYYLCEDRNGPCMELSQAQVNRLVDAAERRYREIVLRDLDHTNRAKPMYRGIERSIVNWYRYESFCLRRAVNTTAFKHEVAAALLVFLDEEVMDVERGIRAPSINCSFSTLLNFATRLGLTTSMLPQGLSSLCPDCSS